MKLRREAAIVIGTPREKDRAHASASDHAHQFVRAAAVAFAGAGLRFEELIGRGFDSYSQGRLVKPSGRARGSIERPVELQQRFYFRARAGGHPVPIEILLALSVGEIGDVAKQQYNLIRHQELINIITQGIAVPERSASRSRDASEVDCGLKGCSEKRSGPSSPAA